MTASTFNPQVEEQQLLAAFARQLEQGGAVAINLPGQPALAASPVLVELLRASLKEFQEGNGVTLLTSKRELSAQEAAELLGVSRPYTDSAKFLHSRNYTACASISRNPYLFLLLSVGLNPEICWIQSESVLRGVGRGAVEHDHH